MEHVLFVVARVEYLRHDVQLIVDMFGGLEQLDCDVEFLILIESQVSCVCGLQVLRENILHEKHKVGLLTRNVARALRLHMKLDVPLLRYSAPST
jgi:hypothetical protein